MGHGTHWLSWLVGPWLLPLVWLGQLLGWW